MQIGFRPVVKIFLLDSNSIRVFLTNSHHSLIVHCVSFCLRRLNCVHTQFHRWTPASGFSGLSVWEKRAVPGVSIKACVSSAFYLKKLMFPSWVIKREMCSCLNLIFKDPKIHLILFLTSHCWYFLCVYLICALHWLLSKDNVCCCLLFRLNISLCIPW